MNCEQFTEQMCIDPATTQPAVLAHERECASCAAFAARARAAEKLIHAALRLDTARLEDRGARYGAVGSIAAAIVAGFALWFALAVDRPAPDARLIAEVVAHWDHDAAALQPSTTGVMPARLAEVLAGEATIDLDALDRAAVGPLTYAKKCVVAGQWMSHLIVQSQDGPITILLIPEQSVDDVIALELVERNLGGGIFPAGSGAVAVFGAGSTAGAPLVQRIVETIDIST